MNNPDIDPDFKVELGYAAAKKFESTDQAVGRELELLALAN